MYTSNFNDGKPLRKFLFLLVFFLEFCLFLVSAWILCLSLFYGSFLLWCFEDTVYDIYLIVFSLIYAWNLKVWCFMLFQISFFSFNFHIPCSFGLYPLFYPPVWYSTLYVFPSPYKAFFWVQVELLGFSNLSSCKPEFSSMFLSPYWTTSSNLRLSLFPLALCLCFLWHPSGVYYLYISSLFH